MDGGYSSEVQRLSRGVPELFRYVTPQNMTACWSSIMKRTLRNWKIASWASIWSKAWWKNLRLWGGLSTGDMFETAPNLPKNFVDLLILDPPYNLSKNYNGYPFKEKEKDTYQKLAPNCHWSFTPNFRVAIHYKNDLIFCSRKTCESLYKSWFVV